MAIACPTQVDSFPYQWLIVKNKTIIGPKSTEEQKVLFIPPQAGVYQAVLSVSSWPASAEAEAVARAEVFAKRVVLVAMAENPALEVDVGKCGSLDFGDLAGGSAKALPLKLLNRTHSTVPIRLVISAVRQYNTLQYSTLQYSTVHYNTVQYSAL
uniref:Uncharacterized protein n=1 Tax=Hucho hucho TaxID=62062 RepID=A0A4W5QI42_9TELE